MSGKNLGNKNSGSAVKTVQKSITEAVMPSTNRYKLLTVHNDVIYRRSDSD
jgi:hypothetical protein